LSIGLSDLKLFFNVHSNKILGFQKRIGNLILFRVCVFWGFALWI